MDRRVTQLVGCGLLAFVSAACPGRTPPEPPEISAPTAGRVGLSDGERAEFYHLEEGSEVFPLEFFLALEAEPGQSGLFAEHLDRFGLLPDAAGPSNPHGLPVGITAATTRDLQLPSVQMVGVNCAACHVSELRHQGKAIRLDGAGGQADITAFYGGLAKAATATLTDPSRFLRFVQRLRARSANVMLPGAAATRSSGVLRGLPDVDALSTGSDFDRALHRELTAAIAEEAGRPAIDLTATLVLKPGPDAAAAQASLGTQLSAGASAQTRAGRVAMQPSDRGVFARAMEGTTPDRRPVDRVGVRLSVADVFSDVITTARLFKARLQFLSRIAQRMGNEGTAPGFGRIDAFGGARSLLFEPGQPSTAPVSYPHLWNFERVPWVHWDANTTSVLERNIGQSLGLGAVLAPSTHQSTVSVVNLHRLEQLARTIRPPRWEDVFGPIDAAASARGASLFETHCASCHAGDPRRDQVVELQDVGTDPNRSVNFNRPVGATPNNEAIADLMDKVKQRAYQEKGLTADQQKQLEGGRPSEWRLTKGYAARPLIAVWATPPYLHNNSVPTLHDLLLPADQRPRTFFVGAPEYDPVKLGFVTEKRERAFEFDTSKSGNANTGHRWGTRELSDGDRRDLLEFLKRF